MNRFELSKKLRSLLKSNNVYFQPPETLKIKYPCIIYELSSMTTSFADNTGYNNRKKYSITIIDKNPDSELPDEIAKLPFNQFDRFFTANNLNHWVFTLFF